MLPTKATCGGKDRSRRLSPLAWLGLVCMGLTCLLQQRSEAAAATPSRFQIEALQQAPIPHAQRLVRLSTQLLGRPYSLSPLGEGPGHRRDTDPRFRLDRFDCVTLTETLMALVWTRNTTDARQLLQRIRYRDGHIGYGTRNHIMMAQWIPHNIANGMLQDISNNFQAGKHHFAELRLSESHFTTEAGRLLRLRKNEQPRGLFRIGLLPIADALRQQQQLPTASIISTVRQSDTQKPYRISHVGLLLRKEKKLVVHHADARKKRVVEESFARFVARAKRQRSWPVVGFNLLALAPQWPQSLRGQKQRQPNVRHR